jgi:tight adherence protein B
VGPAVSALLDNGLGTFVVALGAGLIMLVAVLVAFAKPRGAWVRERIDPYDRYRVLGETASAQAAPGWRPDAERLYGSLARAVEQTRVWKWVMTLLERAGSKLRPSELAWRSLLVGVACAAVVAYIWDSGLLTVLTFLGGGVIAPIVWLKHRARMRRNAFDDQLADALQTMATSLKVGVSFTHSVAVIVEEGLAPTSEEFERLLMEMQLGRAPEEALAAMADRVGSDDLRLVLMSVAIQREVGGSLAELFARISDTVRERQNFRRKVRALTAMGRMSAYFLIALPVITAVVIGALNPGYIAPLFEQSAGHVMIAVGIVMIVIGSFFLKRIVTIKG